MNNQHEQTQQTMNDQHRPYKNHGVNRYLLWKGIQFLRRMRHSQCFSGYSGFLHQ